MSTPASNVQTPPPLPDVQPAAGGAFSTTQGLGQYNFFDPTTANSLGYGIVNNPFQGAFQQGAGVSGALGQAGGLNTFAGGQNLFNTGGILGQNVLANQPGGQQPLYNFLQNQNLQQANAENAMAGIATTPYGAGVADQSNQLFNMNWQNFLQQQQLAAAQGQGQAYGQGSALQNQGAQQYLQGAGTPYGTANTIAQTGLGALGGLTGYGGQAAQIPEQQAQLFGNYALGGQNANIGLANTQLNQANLGFQESMAPWQLGGQVVGAALGTMAGNPTALSSLFSGGGGGGIPGGSSAYMPGGSAYGAYPAYTPGYGYRPMFG